MLAERAAVARLGAGLDPQTQLGPLVSAEQQQRVLGYIESGAQEGAQLLAGGEAALGESGGYFVAPTLFATTSDELRIAARRSSARCWWPAPTTRWRKSPAVPMTATMAWRRASGPATWAPRTAWPRCCAPARCTSTAGAPRIPAAPFGGFKASGVGREHGHVGLDSYLETKTVWASL